MIDRRFNIFMLVLMGIVILLGGAGIYYLRFMVLPEAESDLAAVKAQVVEATKKKSQIRVLEEKNRKLAMEIEENRGKIPQFADKENDLFANTIDRLRQKTRVFIEKADYKPPPRAAKGVAPLPAGIMKAQYAFEVTGGFFQLLNFLNHLETENRFMVVETFGVKALAAAEKKTGFPVRELKITFSTYMSRVPPTPAKKPGEKDRDVKPPPEEEKAKVQTTTPPPE
ncbi:MAG: hypothetical protein HY716_17960 [Planctomycetes bacterium]|nr:hypothetical protein [Planctomycetota bacterium]